VKIHIVKKGDTLIGLAAKYGIEGNAIRSANPQLVDPIQLLPGSKLKVPSASQQAAVAQLKEAGSRRDAKSELDYEYEVLDAQELVDLAEEEEEESEDNKSPTAVQDDKDQSGPNGNDAAHPYQQENVPTYEAGSFHELPEIPGMKERPWGIPYEWPGMAPSYPGLGQEQTYEQEPRQCQSCMGTPTVGYAETMAVPYPIAASPYSYQASVNWMQPIGYSPYLSQMQPYVHDAAYYESLPAAYSPYAAYLRGNDERHNSRANQEQELNQEQSTNEQHSEQNRHEAVSNDAPPKQLRVRKAKRKSRKYSRAVKAEVKSHNSPWINF